MGYLGVEIDWGRMARPQADGYDTEILKQLVAKKYPTWQRLPLAVDEPGMFGHRVRLTNKPKRAAPYLLNADPTHPNVGKTEAFLTAHWPEMAEQCGQLMPEIWIMIDERQKDVPDVSGCTCGDLKEFGSICTTIQGVVGFSHGIVHELGHWKLRAMGVWLLEWDNIVANDPTEMFDSPIRKDIQRPMGACLQAHYSYLHVLEMEIRARLVGGASTSMLETNYGRVEDGRRTLEAWRPVPGTEGFLEAIDEWGADLLARAKPLLQP
jgi:hypothetical protein